MISVEPASISESTISFTSATRPAAKLPNFASITLIGFRSGMNSREAMRTIAPARRSSSGISARSDSIAGRSRFASPICARALNASMRRRSSFVARANAKICGITARARRSPSTPSARRAFFASPPRASSISLTSAAALGNPASRKRACTASRSVPDAASTSAGNADMSPLRIAVLGGNAVSASVAPAYFSRANTFPARAARTCAIAWRADSGRAALVAAAASAASTSAPGMFWSA